MLSRSLLGLTALFMCLAEADGNGAPDLGTVLANNSDLSTYYSLIQKYPDVLLQLPSYAGVTIVVPSNEAFANIPYTALNGVWDPDNQATTVPILQYHILQGTVSTNALAAGPTYIRPTLLTSPLYTNVTAGQNVLVDKQPGDTVVFTTSVGTRCTLVDGDIPFQGGLLQVVDNLLVPPARLENTTRAFGLPNFLGALYAADLMPRVADAQNVTVFAPLDRAFDAVGGSLERVDAAALTRIMAYHVVPGRVLVSSQLANGTTLQTLARDAANVTAQPLLVRQAGNNKYVNSAQIVQPDILLANGIMHIISDVLNPDAFAAAPNPSLPSQPPVFPVNTADNPFTSALPCTTDCPVTTTSAAANSTTAAATTTSLYSSSSRGGAAPAMAMAMATAHVVAGAMLGVGAGMVLM